jgi:alpha-tubulin suppressor-like RCC1 family protein
MNVANIVLSLNSNLSTSLDQLTVSKIIKLLELGVVSNVSSFGALPSASANAGKLYYVTAEGLYWSTGSAWVPISQTFQNTLFSWGYNTNGAVGDETTIFRCSPVSVVGGFTNWCQIDAGGAFALGVRTNCTLWSWGSGAQGRLGNGTTINRSSPGLVEGGFTDWCQATAGFAHSVAVRTNGTTWAWGGNLYGALGDGTLISRSSPVSVVGGFTDWCQVSAGTGFSLGLRSNCTIWAWGSNGSGRLGDGTVTCQSSPVSVVGGFTDWCQVSAGSAHGIGLRTNGSLWAWGSNGSGRLGDNTTTNRSSPVSVVGGFTDWCQVSAGTAHSSALKCDGTAWGWGYNLYGAVGDGTLGFGEAKSSPVSVVGGFTDWCQVSAGCDRSFAIRTNGSLWAWGQNTGSTAATGALADGSTINRASPVSVVGGITNWSAVSTATTTLAIRSINF